MACLASATTRISSVIYGPIKKTDYPYVLLTEGKLLDHPNLEQGNRSRMKIFTVDPTQDIPIVLLEEILQSGLDLYRKGIVKVKKVTYF